MDMDRSAPLVSIIMPVYNAEKYIVEAIESVIAQSYERWELIVVNDGSTDSTFSLLEGFDDERIVIKTQENSGVSAARNRGLALAKGEYITFLDADDLLPKESLAVRVEYLNENPQIDVVDGIILVKDVKMRETLRTYTPYYKGKLLPKLLALDSRVFFNVCYMFRKEILAELTFETRMTHAEDLLFYIQLSSQSNAQYAFVSEIIYLYRSGHTSAMCDVEGLEEGYGILLQEIKKDTHVSSISYMVMKLKIIKIMFLLWMSKVRVKQSFLSIYKLLIAREIK